MPNLTNEQIERHRHGIGASEAAQALGLSQWGTAYDLWLEKRGEGEPREESEALSMGHLLEPVIAKLYEAQNDCTLLPVVETFQHPEHAWLMATPDYRRADDKVVVECKNFNAFRRKEFGDEGTDAIPMDVLVQCLAQLAVMQPLVGASQVDVGVLFGGNEYLQFAVHYDKAAVDRLIERMADFWQKVQTGAPPTPQSTADARRMFARDVGRVVEATPAVAEAVEKLRNIQAAVKLAEEQEDFLKLQIQTHMADASTLVMPDGQIAATWKTAKDSLTFDREAFQADNPDLYQRYLTKKPGSRRFLLK